MKINKLLVCLVAAGMALSAAAGRYKVHLSETVMVAGTELQPGDYSIEINGDKAMIKGGKNTVEAPVKMEEGSETYQANTVRYLAADGKYQISEIHLRGTKQRIIFNN